MPSSHRISELLTVKISQEVAIPAEPKNLLAANGGNDTGGGDRLSSGRRGVDHGGLAVWLLLFIVSAVLKSKTEQELASVIAIKIRNSTAKAPA